MQVVVELGAESGVGPGAVRPLAREAQEDAGARGGRVREVLPEGLETAAPEGGEALLIARIGVSRWSVARIA